MIVYLGLMLCLLSSCGGTSGRKKQHFLEKQVSSKGVAIDVMRQQEAKLSDIPIPIFSEPISKHCIKPDTPDAIILGYHCTLSINELKDFFNQEMERFGWRYGSQFEGHELLLNYEKPDRVCMISLRPKRKETDIIIFSGNQHREI